MTIPSANNPKQIAENATGTTLRDLSVESPYFIGKRSKYDGPFG
jgi:hypothetical protein